MLEETFTRTRQGWIILVAANRSGCGARRLAAAALVAGVAACGADRVSGPGGTGSHSRPAPNPVAVTPSLETSRTDSALVGPDGGTLTATGANGVTYTLVVPPGALAANTLIHMTPIATASGFPTKAGVLAGVQFAPEGLRLLVPGSLTVQGVAAAGSAAVVGFGYFGGGADLYLQHAFVQRGALTMPVAHFSADGITEATAAELDAQRLRAPTHDEAWLAQELAVILSTPPVDYPGMDATLRSYYTDELKPKLTAATTDASKLSIVPVAMSWARQVELLGRGPQLAQEEAEASDLIMKALKNAFDTAYQRCVDNHDLSQVSLMLAYTRALQLQMPADQADQVVDLAKVGRCMTFELDADVAIKVDGSFEGTTVHEQFHFTSAVPVAVTGYNLADVPGYARVAWKSFTFSATLVGLCTSTLASAPTGGVLKVERLDVVVGTNAADSLVVGDVALVPTLESITPGIQSTSCPNMQPLQGPIGTEAAGYFVDATGRTAAGIAPITGWTIVGGQTYAINDVQVTRTMDQGVVVTETAHYTLLHKPSAP